MKSIKQMNNMNYKIDYKPANETTERFLSKLTYEMEEEFKTDLRTASHWVVEKVLNANEEGAKFSTAQRIGDKYFLFVEFVCDCRKESAQVWFHINELTREEYQSLWLQQKTGLN